MSDEVPIIDETAHTSSASVNETLGDEDDELPINSQDSDNASENSSQDLLTDEEIINKFLELGNLLNRRNEAVKELVIFYESQQDNDKLWLEIREDTLCLLRELSDNLDGHHRNVNITNIASSSAGLMGGGMIIAGLVMAPATLGASLSLTVAGGVTSAVATGTGVGARLTELGITKNRLKIAQEILDEDKKVTSVLYCLIDRLDEISEKVYLMTDNLNKWTKKEKLEAILSGASLAYSGFSLGKNTGLLCLFGQKTAELFKAEWSAAGLVFRESTKQMVTTLKVLGSAVAAIGMGFDAYQLVTTGKDMKNGSKSKQGDQLRELAQKLEEERDQVKQFYVEMKMLMAGCHE